MKNFLLGLLDWIYKKRCYFCKNSTESVKMCSKCFEELEHLPVVINRKTLNTNIYCAGQYNKNLQKLIRGLKYHNQPDLAYYLAKFMYQYWEKLGIQGDFQIIPVPIFPKRKKQRKYNHMDLVAEELSRMTGYEVNFNIIKRIKDTKPQYNLKKYQRTENLANAFEIDKTKVIPNKKILIIDDICTTGSTFEEMIKEFHSIGVYDIICFAGTTPFEV